MDVFNTREIAIGIWLSIILVFLLYNVNTRHSLYGVLRAFFQKPILISFILLLAYTCLSVWTLEALNLWNWSQLKNTIFWFIGIALINLFQFTQRIEKPGFIKSVITENLRFIVLIEFVVSFFPLQLWQEILLVPFMTFLTGAVVMSEKKAEYKAAYNFFSGLLVLIGITLTIIAFYKLYLHYNDFAKLSTLYDFIVPILLFTALTPFLYALYLNWSNGNGHFNERQ